MDRWRGKVAIVTGASSGIGAAITEKLIKEGITVVGIARGKENLLTLSERLKGQTGKFYFRVADVTKEEDVLSSFSWVTSNVGPIHILVNNAGLFVMTNTTEGKTELWKKVFDTNTLSLCVTTREAVKCMKENSVNGHIIHINSTAGHSVKFWQTNVYPASKYAVTALTETLRQELISIGSKIKVTSISPGYVHTNLISAGVAVSGVPKSKFWQNCEEKGKPLKAEDVGEAVAYVLSTPPHVQVDELILAALF